MVRFFLPVFYFLMPNDWPRTRCGG